MAGSDLGATQRQQLEQRQSLLGSLIASDVLQHRLGLSILSDDHGRGPFPQFPNNIGTMCFEVADGLDATFEIHSERLRFEFGPNIVHSDVDANPMV